LSAVCDIAGVSLIALGLVDVFLTMLADDESGLLVEPGYRVFWRAISGMTRHLPARIGGVLRSTGAPFMVAGSVAVWTAREVIRFALLYLRGVVDGSLALHGSRRSFRTALYLSGVTISSLSFSGAQPAHAGFFFLARWRR
jgi:hypothetical protein